MACDVCVAVCVCVAVSFVLLRFFFLFSSRPLSRYLVLFFPLLIALFCSSFTDPALEEQPLESRRLSHQPLEALAEPHP